MLHVNYATMRQAKKVSVWKRSDACRDGLEHSCLVRWQFFNIFLRIGKTKIPSIKHHRFGSTSLVPTYLYVYQRYTIIVFLG